MSDPVLALLAVHAAATLFMTGLVWFVQVVHYPLYARVGPGDFVRYETDHTRRTGWIVAPAMAVEAASAAALLRVAPAGVPPAWTALGAALLALIWLSTFLIQVPRHTTLSRGFDRRAHALLVRTNWLRTAAWTARAPLALAMLVAGATAGARP